MPSTNRLTRWVAPLTLAIIAIVSVASFMGRTDTNPSTVEFTQAGQASPTTTAPQTATTVPPASSDEITGLKAAPELKGTGQLPTQGVTKKTQGGWGMTEFKHTGSNPIVKDFMGRLRNLNPKVWSTFPNVPNKDVPQFRVVDCPTTENPGGKCVPDGMEYGTHDSPFCENPSLRCDFVVPARHYSLYTGDYGFLNLTCNGDGKKGCALLLVNVDNHTYTWRDQAFDNGFKLMGEYFNGDQLQWGIEGVASHAVANMLGMPTFRNPLTGDVLNAGTAQDTNAGANCGRFDACESVEVTVIIHNAQPAVLYMARTVVTPNGVSALV